MSKIQIIEILFPVPIDFPEGWEETLSSLINMICEQYKHENPDRVMWTAGHGFKPIWNEPHEPTYDENVYQIEVAERKDLYGQNHNNPYRERLREEAKAKRAARKHRKA